MGRPPIAEAGAKVLESAFGWAQRARQRLSEKIAEASATGVSAGYPSDDTAANLPMSSAVRLSGLQGTPELNGQMGEVVGFDEASQRWRVKLACDGNVKLVRREKLQVIHVSKTTE